MSNRALTWAFAQTTGNPGRKAVLVALADMADEANSCWPEQATLAAMTDQSPRSVRLHLARLEQDGLIGRAHRYGADGRRTSDRYTLPVQVVARVAPLPAKAAASLPAKPAASEPSLPAENVATTGRSRQVTHKNPQPPPTEGDAPAAKKKAERLPDGWRRKPADIDWQHREGIPDEFARPVTAEFVNYWTAAAGRNASKLDWSAAWKVWMGREWREKGPRWQRDRGVTDPATARRDAAVARRRSSWASAI